MFAQRFNLPAEMQKYLENSQEHKHAGRMDEYFAAQIKLAQYCLATGRGEVAGDHFAHIADSTNTILVRYLAIQAYWTAGNACAAHEQLELAYKIPTLDETDYEILNKMRGEIYPVVRELRAARARRYEGVKMITDTI